MHSVLLFSIHTLNIVNRWNIFDCFQRLGKGGYFSRYLQSLKRNIDDATSPDIGTIQDSVDRLLNEMSEGEAMRTVIKMISLVSEKMISYDLVTAFAEVAVASANGQVWGSAVWRMLSFSQTQFWPEMFIWFSSIVCKIFLRIWLLSNHGMHLAPPLSMLQPYYA